MSECFYTAGEIIAALRQVYVDYMETPTGEGIGTLTDKAKLAVRAALGELAHELEIDADKYENRTAGRPAESKS